MIDQKEWSCKAREYLIKDLLQSHSCTPRSNPQWLELMLWWRCLLRCSFVLEHWQPLLFRNLNDGDCGICNHSLLSWSWNSITHKCSKSLPFWNTCQPLWQWHMTNFEGKQLFPTDVYRAHYQNDKHSKSKSWCHSPTNK